MKLSELVDKLIAIQNDGCNRDPEVILFQGRPGADHPVVTNISERRLGYIEQPNQVRDYTRPVVKMTEQEVDQLADEGYKDIVILWP